MNNPQKILTSLDQHLQAEVDLILYGRAALVMGYENCPPELASTMDVDAILPGVQMKEIEKNDDFWGAVEAVNQELETSGMYITHLFADDQVIHSLQNGCRISSGLIIPCCISSYIGHLPTISS